MKNDNFGYNNLLEQKMQQLIELIRYNPCVKSCLHRMICEIVPASVEVKEKGKPLSADLDAFFGPYLSNILSESLEMAYMCGFVVFVVKRNMSDELNVNKPVLLPLGSFTWSVQCTTKTTKKRKREDDSLYRYEVFPIHPEITQDDLFVFNFQNPSVRNNSFLPSPIDSLCNSLQNMRMMQTRINDVVDWNSKKHITTSERVDIPKDQTTDGISLLDDFRRYIISGQHSGISKHYMMRNGPGQEFARENPSNAAAAWIHNTAFGKYESDQQANVHMLPPNTDISELSSLDLNVNMNELNDLFQQEVHEFFHFTPASEVGATNGNASYVTQNEIKSMRQLGNFATRLLQYIYACTFDVPLVYVSVSLPQPTGMFIQSADDVKKLQEAGTLLPGDSLKLRKNLMRHV